MAIDCGEVLVGREVLVFLLFCITFVNSKLNTCYKPSCHWPGHHMIDFTAKTENKMKTNRSQKFAKLISCQISCGFICLSSPASIIFNGYLV